MPAVWTAPRTWTDAELVTASLLNPHIRDNLEWLKGRPVSQVQDFDGTVFSTTSASFQDTGISVTITTTGGRVLVVAFGTVYAQNSTLSAQLSLYQDGSNVGHSTEGMTRSNSLANGLYTPFGIVYLTPTAPSAASHTWNLHLKSSNGSSTASLTQVQMWAMEIGA
jgi:hypothetical protein